MKWISQVLALLLFSSCSTKWHEFFFNDHNNNVRNEKLMKSFEVEDDVLEKFKVEDKPKEAIVTPQKTTIEPISNKAPEVTQPIRKTIRPNFEQIKKLNSSHSAGKKTTNKIPETTKIVMEKYPDEYPEDLIELNKRTKKYWDKFQTKVFPGEKTFFKINYMGVSTGNIILSVNSTSVIDGKKSYSLNARAKTSSYYSYLYELDDNIDSYVQEDNYLPIKFSLIQRESGQDIDDLQLFDNEKMKTYYFYKRVTKKKTKKKKGEMYLPSRFVDPLSVIWFLRGHPLNKGKVYEIPIMNKGRVIILKTQMLGIEEITTNLGKKEAIKVLGTTTYSGETLKSGDMTFWFSNDEKRTFLRFEAKIKIGAISGEIDKYEF